MSNENWYNNLKEDCEAIVIETIYRSRQEMIEGKHQLGERIVNDPYFKKIQGQKAKQSIIQKLAVDIGISKTEAYYCVQFYEKYPHLSELTEKSKEQKNLSWNKIVRNYLPARTEKQEPCKHENLITICQDCRMRVK